MQTAKGGYDFLLLNRYACEVKRRATGKSYRPSWWAQAVRQADDAGLQPLLFYRFDRKPWRVVGPDRQYESIEELAAAIDE